LFSEKKLNAIIIYKCILKMEILGLFSFVKLNINSKTQKDSKSFKQI